MDLLSRLLEEDVSADSVDDVDEEPEEEDESEEDRVRLRRTSANLPLPEGCDWSSSTACNPQAAGADFSPPQLV